MLGNNIELEMFIDSRHPKRDFDFSLKEPTGIRHFALKIDGKLEKEIERLNRLSDDPLSFGPVMEDWHKERYVFVKDPDGLLIELHE